MLRIDVVHGGIKLVIGNTLEKLVGIGSEGMNYIKKLFVARGTGILHGVKNRVTRLAVAITIWGFEGVRRGRLKTFISVLNSFDAFGERVVIVIDRSLGRNQLRNRARLKGFTVVS